MARKPDPDVAQALQDGFKTDQANPHLWSSTMWESFEVGRFLRVMEAEDDCKLLRCGRGSTYQVDSFSACCVYLVAYAARGQHFVRMIRG